MMSFEISGRKIGPQEIPLVIPEIGINHNGSLREAMKIVDSAQRAGAEVIKHQTHIVQAEMVPYAKQVIPGNSDKSIYQIIDECALCEEDERKLQEYVLANGMIFLSTPFSKAAVDRLESMDVPAYKVGSGECNNYPLLKYIASKRKPIILSTGMNDLGSIGNAVEILDRSSVPYALLHCVSLYPTSPELIQLGAIRELASHFKGALVGYSDHSVGNLACYGAMALGASIIEKHFTDSFDRHGPDIACSMDEEGLRKMISASRFYAKARGGRKTDSEDEQITREFAFASVVTLADIKKGEILGPDNLWVKRPGLGEFPAASLDGVFGKRASCNIAKDVMLKKEHIAGAE